MERGYDGGGYEHRGDRRDGGRRDDRDDRDRRARSSSRDRSPKRSRRDSPYRGGRGRDDGQGGAWDDHGRGRQGDGGRRRRGELLSFKQFAASTLPANLSDAEAEARHGCTLRKRSYAAYKRSHAQLQHRDYFAAHKDDEWMRQQFDPRRLEAAVKQRAEASVLAAAEFSVTAALETQPGAANAAEEPSTADQARRWAHDVTQAHSLCILLNTEKALLADTAASTQGIDADALSDAAARCAEAWEGEPEVAKRTASACASYLWRVHGVDYFAGTELSASDYRTRLSRTPATPPADAGSGAAWEAAVDAAWQRRLAGGDGVAQMLATDAVEAAVETFVTTNIRSSSDGKKHDCLLCGKAFVESVFVRKHVTGKHAQLLTDARSKALDDVFCDNYVRHAELAEAAGGALRPHDAERDARPRFKSQQTAPRLDGDFNGPRGPRRGREHRDGGHFNGRGGGYAQFPGGPPVVMGGAGTVLVPAPGAGWAGPFVPVTLGAGGMLGSPGEGGGRGAPPVFLPGSMPAAAYVDLDAQAPPSSRPILEYGDL